MPYRLDRLPRIVSNPLHVSFNMLVLVPWDYSPTERCRLSTDQSLCQIRLKQEEVDS